MCSANGASRPEAVEPLATRAAPGKTHENRLNLARRRQELFVGLRHDPRRRRGRRLCERLSAVAGNQTNIACHYGCLRVASWGKLTFPTG